jgi:tungstate transport system substrate-binding protein
MNKVQPLVLITALASICSTVGLAAQKSIHLQSTTSTKNSGFYEYILPLFEAETGITVHVVAVGTGQAIKNAQNCDGDVLLTHAPADEEKFISEGFGVRRIEIMQNDFIIVGPKADPAKIAGLKDVETALENIARSKSPFASRGDNSGTHKKEKSLWQSAGIIPTTASGSWYRETGSGMGTTLNTSVGMASYTLTDRATWVAFKNKYDFRIHVEGDRALLNQYSIILVNPAKCPAVKVTAGQKFIDWLTSPKGQTAIRNFRKNGQQLFVPNAAINSGR